jgi:hypothetical protein
MRHVDDHDVAEDVGVAEFMLQTLQLLPCFLKLRSSSRLSIVHHHSHKLQLLIQLGFSLGT